MTLSKLLILRNCTFVSSQKVAISPRKVATSLLKVATSPRMVATSLLKVAISPRKTLNSRLMSRSALSTRFSSSKAGKLLRSCVWRARHSWVVAIEECSAEIAAKSGGVRFAIGWADKGGQTKASRLRQAAKASRQKRADKGEQTKTSRQKQEDEGEQTKASRRRRANKDEKTKTSIQKRTDEDKQTKASRQRQARQRGLASSRRNKRRQGTRLH